MYKHHSLALNEKDQEIFEKVNKKTGYGVTEIFRRKLYELSTTTDQQNEKHNEEE